MTEIKYTHVPTAQQWLWLLQTTGRRRWIALRVMGFLLIAIGLLDLAWGGQLWLVCLVLAVPVIFLPTIVTRAAVRRITAVPVATSEREVTISDRGVEVVQPLARVWYDLSLLKSIVTGPLGWILLSEGGMVTLVPRSALTSDQIGQMESFALTYRRSNTDAA